MTHRTVRNRDIVVPTSDILRDLGWLLMALAILLALSGLVAGWSIPVVMGTYLVPAASGTVAVRKSKKVKVK
jgi:hypothetical protein